MIDITGQRFGRWTVVGEVRDSAGKHAGWKCRCDCGNERTMRGSQLRNGKSKSCGCLSVDLARSRYNDLTGMKFGRLTAIRRVENIGHKVAWECRCDCGRTVRVTGDALHRGTTQSCGCLHKEVTHNLLTTHGQSKGKLYGVYNAMKRRCYSEKDSHYKHYGGRGIKICDEWLGSGGFASFSAWAHEHGYQDGLSIDRVDNNGDYTPDNCRWADRFTQGCNKRNNVVVTACGQERNISSWGRKNHLDGEAIRKRLARGWTVEEAVGEKEHKRDWEASARKRHDARYITVKGETKHIMDWSKESGICESTIQSRLKRGWSPEDAVFVPLIRKGHRLETDK